MTGMRKPRRFGKRQLSHANKNFGRLNEQYLVYSQPKWQSYFVLISDTPSAGRNRGF
jgi:hypothetical protein